MACPQCEPSRREHLVSCTHCGATLAEIPALAQARDLLRRRLYQEAESVLGDVIKQLPGCSEAHTLLAAALAGTGRKEAALPHFEQAVRLAVASAPARYNLGVAYRAAGRVAEARQQLQYALQVDPGYEKARTALAGLPAEQAPGESMRTLEETARGPVERMATLGETVTPPADVQAPTAQAAPEQRRLVATQDRARPRWSASSALAMVVAVGAALLGGALVLLCFRLTTSSCLVNRQEAFLAFGAKGSLLVALLSGVAAAAMGATGAPRAGALGGLAAGSLGFMMGSASEAIRPPANILAATSAAGLVLGVLGEAGTRMGPLAERRAWVLWAALLVSLGIALRLFFLQGSVMGAVFYIVEMPDGSSFKYGLPGAKITLWDREGKQLICRTSAVNTGRGLVGGGIVQSGTDGSYTVQSVPAGEYKVMAEHPQTGESTIKMLVKADYTFTGGTHQDLYLYHKVEAPKRKPIPMPEEWRQRLAPGLGVSAPAAPAPAPPPTTRRVMSPLGGTIKLPTRAPSSMDQAGTESE